MNISQEDVETIYAAEEPTGPVSLLHRWHDLRREMIPVLRATATCGCGFEVRSWSYPKVVHKLAEHLRSVGRG